MSLQQSTITAAGLLGVALLGQWGLQSHLAVVNDRPIPELRKPLKDLPLDLTAVVPEDERGPEYTPPFERWRGTDFPDTNLDALAKQIPFADEFLYRFYVPEPGRPAAVVYMVHSRTGQDRDHHPEVCVRDVSGAAEDTEMRAIVFLDEGKTRPVQRFRFRTGRDSHTVIYYWHYTFNAPPVEGASVIQQLYGRLSRKPPSITVQVSTQAEPAELPALEATLLTALDQEMMKSLLPPGAAMGCDRVPIQVIRP